MSEDDWKSAFRIFSRERVCICVTDTSVVDLNSDLVSLRRFDFDFFNAEVFSRFPRNSSLLSRQFLIPPTTLLAVLTLHLMVWKTVRQQMSVTYVDQSSSLPFQQYQQALSRWFVMVIRNSRDAGKYKLGNEKKICKVLKDVDV